MSTTGAETDATIQHPTHRAARAADEPRDGPSALRQRDAAPAPAGGVPSRLAPGTRALNAWAWPRPVCATETWPADQGPRLVILGTRGIPARHGGFETFAERLALHLAGRGWRVTVACQAEASGGPTAWRGIRLRQHRPWSPGPLGAMEMDLRATTAVLREGTDIALTLGYNTAVLGGLLRAARIPHLMNMDGIEWQRAKWSLPVRGWLWLNERAGRYAADHLIADHPCIAEHLVRHAPAGRISVIPYGADPVTAADPQPIRARLGLEPGRYVTSIARIEPENSVLDLVAAYSRRPRGMPLVVLGRLDGAGNAYHAAIRAAASAEVIFAGAIYEQDVVASLRAHAALHVHGHRVGGTNPSLVEALGAGNAVLAHDNRFNRWVAGSAATYFSDADGCAAALDELLASPARCLAMRAAARSRHASAFEWELVLAAYEELLLRWLPAQLFMPAAEGPRSPGATPAREKTASRDGARGQ